MLHTNLIFMWTSYYGFFSFFTFKKLYNFLIVQHLDLLYIHLHLLPFLYTTIQFLKKKSCNMAQCKTDFYFSLPPKPLTITQLLLRLGLDSNTNYVFYYLIYVHGWQIIFVFICQLYTDSSFMWTYSAGMKRFDFLDLLVDSLSLWPSAVQQVTMAGVNTDSHKQRGLKKRDLKWSCKVKLCLFCFFNAFRLSWLFFFGQTLYLFLNRFIV